MKTRLLCACRQRTVSKEYLAITVGCPQLPPQQQTLSQLQQQDLLALQQQSGRDVFAVDAAIDQHPQYDTARMIVASGKPALTYVEVSLARWQGVYSSTRLCCGHAASNTVRSLQGNCCLACRN